MRSQDDSNYGHFSEEHHFQKDGDNRSAFIQLHLGHRPHHLMLWHWADEMGVLSNCINVLSAEVGADGDNVHVDTAKVQKKRSREVEDKDDREEKKAFRNTLGDAITGLASSTRLLAKTKKVEAIQNLIAQKTSARALDEDKMVKYHILSLETSGELKEMYTSLVETHRSRIADYNHDITALEDKLFSGRT